jgi:hypothetical protein
MSSGFRTPTDRSVLLPWPDTDAVPVGLAAALTGLSHDAVSSLFEALDTDGKPLIRSCHVCGHEAIDIRDTLTLMAGATRAQGRH